MGEMTLTQIEVSGIQDYIFGSNNLKQNIGASELVTAATTDWVVETLRQEDIAHNAIYDDAAKRWRLGDWTAVSQPAQIVYWGGGNALILFSGPQEQYAIPFTKQLTRKATEQARGLSLVIAHQSLDWEKDVAAHKHTSLREIIAARKLNRRQDTPLLGLGVTANCVFTGLPAVALDEDSNLISQVVQDKRSAYDKAKARLTNLLQHESRGYDFVEDFNLLGERGESSYTAVIHADGNGMGKRFEAIATVHPTADRNDAYCQQLRRLSEAVEARAENALKATVRFLVASRDLRNGKFGGVVPCPTRDDDEKALLLPFRPIVFGGDDVTFVSEGRLGLSLAAYYLKTVAEGNLPGAEAGETGDPLYARAGVAVVKTHYPFARAYELASALCDSAKMKLPELTPQGKGIVLDWHFATSGVILSLRQLREREYRSQAGHSLLMRPVRIDVDTPPVESQYWRSWANFATVTHQFQEDKTWYERRNKVKALREPLRHGGTSVRLFRQNYGLPKLPLIPNQSTVMAETGWNSEDCGYFDAIEALDFYVHLEGKANGSI